MISSLSNPPASVPAGGNLSVTDTTSNQGNGPAVASMTRYRLSTDTTITSTDLLLGSRWVLGPFAAGGSSSGTVTVTVPLTVAAGSYYLGACADNTNGVQESNETDNCRTSATTVQVTVQPNVVISSLTNPPASMPAGGSFSVTDTTLNQGNTTAGASTTRYRLSTDTTITSTDQILGSRSVPGPTAAGGSSTGSVTVVIPWSLAPGPYYLGACGDDTNVVAESNELDNCRVSTTTLQVNVHINLWISSLSNPPASMPVGGSFEVTDTTSNQGTGSAGSSTTRYRLSTDATITSADPILTGSRWVPALVSGWYSTGRVEVTIPSAVAIGTYYLGACADDTNVVAESNETNNCRASATTIQVILPPGDDLVVTTVTDPPSTAVPGDSFSETDTVLNQGNGTAGASTTYYYLSLDDRKDADDILLTGDRSIPSLGAGATSSGTVTVTIPSTVKSDFYFLLACADDAYQVLETDENNNCVASKTTVQVK